MSIAAGGDRLNQAFAGQRILVTGHTGFKGSWLSLWLSMLGADVYGYALEEPGAPASYSAMGVAGVLRDERIADVRELDAFVAYFELVRPTVCFHLAAQSLVRASYRDPIGTLQTNTMGTAHVLEAVRMSSRPCAVVVVTSDKCYENFEIDRPYDEDDRIGGRDMYSMSKGSCELLASAYRSSFFPVDQVSKHGVRVASVRAGNVIGGGDYATDRILPDCIRSLREGKPVLLRNPMSVRPWQHVLEPLHGYLELGAALLGPEPASFCEGWNFGPDPSEAYRVVDVVEQVISAWGSGSWAPQGEGQRPHEAKLLRLSIEKAKSKLNWKPRMELPAAVAETIAWYRQFESLGRRAGTMREMTLAQIRKYMEAAR